MDGPYTLIANAKSGKRKKELLDRLRARLSERLGVEVKYAPVKSGHEIRSQAKAARDVGHGTVFAAGGDGTLSGVADILKGSDVTMAALPMGTFNFFARGLEIPEDPDGAVDAICDGVVQPFPVGELNGRLFLNNASLGVYPAILRARESVYKNWGRSRIAAYWTVLKTLAKPGHGMHVRITADGETQDLVTPMIFIGSNPFQLKHFHLDGAELPDAGKLALFYGPDTGRFGMLRTAIWLAFRAARKDREFKIIAGKHIKIELPRRKRATVALDGERLRFDTPIELHLREHLLNVVVPRGSAAERAA